MIQVAAEGSSDSVQIPLVSVTVVAVLFGIVLIGVILFAGIAWFTGAMGPLVAGSAGELMQYAVVAMAMLLVIGPMYGVWRFYKSVSTSPGR